jgi:F0F1-type ATP synthase epsilon subunit
MTVRTITAEIRTRNGLVFSGELEALSSVNRVGPFDILPGHTNFVSMIKEKLVLHKQKGERQEIGVENGVMIVEGNKVRVFLGVSKV